MSVDKFPICQCSASSVDNKSSLIYLKFCKMFSLNYFNMESAKTKTYHSIMITAISGVNKKFLQVRFELLSSNSKWFRE